METQSQAAEPSIKSSVKSPEDQTSRQLTPEEISVRQSLKAKLMEVHPMIEARSASVSPFPGSLSPVDTLVAIPANPYLALYRDYKTSVITLEELEEAIDADICGDERKLQGYAAKQLPFKPFDLVKAEDELRKVTDPKEWPEEVRDLRQKLAAAKPEIYTWLRAVAKITTENELNVSWLKEMLTRQKNRNPIFAARLRATIMTYEAA